MKAPIESPDVFRGEPGRGAGVRRMNRRPLMVVFAIAAIVLGVVGYTVLERGEEDSVVRKRDEKKAEAGSADSVLGNAPKAGLIEAKTPPKAMPAPTIVSYPGEPAPPTDRPPGDVDVYAQEWQQYRQQEQQLRQAKVQAEQAALSAPPAVADAASAAKGKGGAAGPVLPRPPELGAELSERLRGLAGANGGAGGANGSADENRAGAKVAWLNAEAKPTDYLASTRTEPVSSLEIKTGTVIPGIMIGGINSDLPGQIVAQVRENVYDTATGQHLLIPQGARLIGVYDNQVTRGQSRVLAAWNRIVFPDASTLNLENMPGADQAGYAGFSDKVNNHYWRVFGDALLLSVFSAGIQLSQPQSQVGDTYNSSQIIAASLGQQLGQAGMQVTQRNLSIQPTLQVRPGYRFNVMVTKDMILPVWGGR